MCLDFGIPQVQAASLLAAMGIFDFFGTIMSGWLSDRYDNRWLLFWYYGLRGLSLLMLPFTDFSFYGLSLFAMFYGLDWIATVPPTVRLTAQRFGAERANLVFGWIFAGHQIGAAFAAFGAGLSRTVLATYLPAFFFAGALCVIAAVIVLAISRAPKPVVSAKTPLYLGCVSADLSRPLAFPDHRSADRQFARARRAQRLGEAREFAQQRASLARVDDLLDPELLGGAKWRAQFVEPILDLFELGLRIVGRIDVGAIGRLDPAFQRQRTPIGRRPRIAHRKAVGRLMHHAGDAKGIAHDDGAPGNGGLVDRGHRAHAVTDGGGLLGLEPDHEARAIHQIDHRQMEGLGEVDPANDLLAGVRRPRSAVVEGIAGQHQYRPAFAAAPARR